jgi:ribosomal protein S18 acetylase RimI-like enzyme
MTAATRVLSNPTLRPASEADSAFLWTLYRASRLDEVKAWGWPDAQVDSFLQMQWQIERRARASQYPAADHQIVLDDARPIGRLLVDRTPERTLLVDIALLPDARGGAVGTRLLRALIDEASARAVPLTLSVARDNGRAEKLYRRLGFTVVGETEVLVAMVIDPRAQHA